MPRSLQVRLGLQMGITSLTSQSGTEQPGFISPGQMGAAYGRSQICPSGHNLWSGAPSPQRPNPKNSTPPSHLLRAIATPMCRSQTAQRMRRPFPQIPQQNKPIHRLFPYAFGKFTVIKGKTRSIYTSIAGRLGS